MKYLALLLNKAHLLISKGSVRSVRAKKNILASFLFKGGTILIGFFLVPLSLDYLDVTRYGIWLTLNSIIGWFSFFDIGLGHGLRNKFATAKANQNHHLVQIYVSTTYALVTIIVSILMILFFAGFPWIKWHKLLNASPEMEHELSILAVYLFSFFGIKFLLKLITTILTADQKPAANTLINFLSQLLALLSILILVNTTPGSILYLGISLTSAPLVVLLVSSIVLFRTRYKQYLPRFKFVDFSYSRDLLGLGIQFFIIQIAAVILFTTDNMIITQILGPAEVTAYNIAHKYFHILLMVFVIIMSPFWTAFTDAYTLNDFNWIRRVISKLLRVWVVFVLVALIMLMISNIFYEFWVGEEVIVPFALSSAMAFFMVAQTLNTIFVHFINGTGKLRLQILTAIFTIIFNIPLSILFAKYFHLGSAGVILATTVSTCLSIVLRYIQYSKIINQTASGIWNK